MILLRSKYNGTAYSCELEQKVTGELTVTFNAAGVEKTYYYTDLASLDREWELPDYTTGTYVLKKDLPTFNKGDRFKLAPDGCLYLIKDYRGFSPHWKDSVMAYHKNTLEKFPNILKDWFKKER